VGSSTRERIVHGDDLLYRFFQEIFEGDTGLADWLPQRMLGSMAIWLPLDVYHEWPVLLPGSFEIQRGAAIEARDA
jgi:hypothetical protein